MTNLLPNLSKELEDQFNCNISLEQLHSNLFVLGEELQLLITKINQNLFIRRPPDVGMSRKIKLIESLAREITQIYRNAAADEVTNLALDKDIRRKRRVLRKLKRTGSSQFERLPLKSRRRLSPIRESIPLPPASTSSFSPVNFRVNANNSSTPSSSSFTLDTDEPLEFDLV